MNFRYKTLTYNPSDMSDLSEPKIDFDFYKVFNNEEFATIQTVDMNIEATFSFSILGEKFEASYKIITGYKYQNSWSSNDEYTWQNDLKDNIKNKFQEIISNYWSIFRTKIGGSYNGKIEINPSIFIPNWLTENVHVINNQAINANVSTFSLINTTNNIIYN